MKKKLLIITCILTILLAFTKSYDVKGTEELSYIIAIGLDKSDSEKEPLSLTIQIAKPDTTGETGGTTIKTETETVNCNSFNLGLSMLNLENVNELNLSHCTAIVISEEIAKEGIENFINTLTNNIEIRPTCNMLISQCKASELLEQASTIEDISSKFYSSFINSAKITSYVTNCQLSSFFASLHGDVTEPLALYTFIKNDTIESIGLAVFKDYKMVGRLSGLDTLCYNLLTNEFEEATIEVYNPQNPSIPLAVHLSGPTESKIKVSLENNVLKIKCDISVNSAILSASKNYDFSTENSRKEIEAEINKFLKESFSTFLNKTSKEYNSDIIGFKGYFNKNYLTQDELNNYNWNTLYPKAEFEINVTNYLTSGFLFSKN